MELVSFVCFSSDNNTSRRLQSYANRPGNVGQSDHALTTPETHGTTKGAVGCAFLYESEYLSLKFILGFSACILMLKPIIYEWGWKLNVYEEILLKRKISANIMKRKAETYIFQPAFLMFVFIDIWRVAPCLRRTINPYITFLFTGVGSFSLIQASLTAVGCTFFMVGKAPSNSCTTIICMKFSMAFRWNGPAR